MQQAIKYIGIVSSSLKKLEDCPRQENESAPEATIHIEPAFLTGIKNILPGDKLVIFTWLHQADRSVLECHPRDNREMPLTGVFSTRSADRPNPIGIHAVTVISVSEGGSIKVSNLEVLDRTPVIDIKPVL